ncbi:MAG TPA: DUF29 domain-containing protein [Cyanothece sp. UBA12306]|nr:DUF29 domain-containing protein [Cyanothece sp. UBA12306]
MTLNAEILTQTLYDQDYYLWLQTTIEQLRNSHFSALDRENLIEELESMGKSDKRALKSLLTRLLEHLFKLVYWTSERNYNANKWKSEITAFRKQINDLLKDSPSLKPYLAEIIDDCFLDAREIVSHLINQEIPHNKIATIEQLLNKDWFPEL